MTNMSERILSDEELERCIELASLSAHGTRSRIRRLTAASRHLAAKGRAEAAQVATGRLLFANALTIDSMEVTLRFDDGSEWSFCGETGGLGCSGKTIWGAAAFNVVPEQLAGEASFEVSPGAGGEDGICVTWWREDLLLGTFVGTAPAVGSLVLQGDGHWRNKS